MIIDNILFNAEVIDIITELQSQLIVRGIPYLKDVKNTLDNVMITCPYHKNGQERRPSAGIHTTDGMFHCFTCGEVHSLTEVISHCFGYDDNGEFGKHWIVSNFVSVAVENRVDILLDLDRKTDITKHNSAYTSELELDSYRYYHPYMWKLRLTPGIVEMFDIGYDKNTKCLTFPIRDINGNTLFVARRSVNTKFFNYPSGAEKPVYGLYEYKQYCEQNALDTKPDVIICESMLDATTCYVYGKCAVALNGTGNELQFKQLSQMPCRKFILATDNDDAGRKARKRLKKYIKNHIITEYEFPNGIKDINEMSKEQFENLIEIF